MNHEKIRYGITLFLMLLVIVAQSFLMYIVYENSEESADLSRKAIIDLSSVRLYDAENKPKVMTMGVYFAEGYYCVRTEGRDWKSIQNTDDHERCHALLDENPKCKAFIKMDFQHFINGSDQTAWNVEDYIG